MQQVLGGAQPQQPAAVSCRVPPQARAGLLPLYRRSETLLVCRARKTHTQLVAELASVEPAALPGGDGSIPAAVAPPPDQQHAQPPRPGVQERQQAGESGSRAKAPKQQQQKVKTAAALSRGATASQAGDTGDSLASASSTSASSTSSNNSTKQVEGSLVPADALQAAVSQEPAPAAAASQLPAAAEASQEQAAGPDTQLIFRLERRGEGWGEEILPHLVVEQRPLSKKKRTYSRPDPWKEGSLECYLVELGVPPADVDRVVAQAVAWRVTPGGRSLIDRRRRSRVERNVRLVVEHLELECGVPFGPLGIAAILARCPEVMLCKPTTNDRWDRRAVELSAFLLRQGHCNVPEDWEESPELGLWVKRQRIARAAGQLNEERLSILQAMGFDFGEVAQLTEEWEHRFDQLVDWMLWHNENQQRFSWLGVDWGARGGITARELALWVTLQREYRARGLLPAEALTRFEAIGMQADALMDGTLAEREWMAWFGRLLYVVERHNSNMPPAQRDAGARPKTGRTRTGSSGSDSEGEEGGSSEEEDEEEEAPGGQMRSGSAAVAAARQRLQADMAARRAALAAADLRLEPGLRFWLARQQRRWRMQQLPGEMALMLQLAGVQLDPYSPVEWQALAHQAAALLQGSQITLDLRTQRQLRKQQRAAAAAEAARMAAAAAAVLPGDGTVTPPVAAVAAAAAAQASSMPPPAAAAAVAAAAGIAGRVTTRVGEEEACGAAGRAGRQGEQPPAVQQAPAGSSRLRVARWVQTQQALFAEGKLSQAQLRYMAFLGITWVLSEEVVHMAEPRWHDWCARLAAAPRPLPPRGELWEWLQHQRGLHALGWLPAKRRLALEAMQVRLDSFARCEADEEWDLRLSELLAYKARHGHCRMPAAAAEPAAAEAAAQQGDVAERQRWAPLAAWLAEQHRLAAAGRLPQPRLLQLVAIGAVATPAPRAVPAAQARQQAPTPA